MNVPTLREFADDCGNIPPSLVRAVVRQIGGWESFKESAPDVANHGIDGGFHGFIWYAETSQFQRRNRDAIATLAREMADDLGEKGGAVALVRGFGCFRGGELPDPDAVAIALYGGHVPKRLEDDVQTVRNALAWFAAEEVCRAWADRVSS